MEGLQNALFAEVSSDVSISNSVTSDWSQPPFWLLAFWGVSGNVSSCSQSYSFLVLHCFILLLSSSRFRPQGLKSSRICTFSATWAVLGTWPGVWLHSRERPKCLAALWRELQVISHGSTMSQLHLPCSLVSLEAKLDRGTELNCISLGDIIVCRNLDNNLNYSVKSGAFLLAKIIETPQLRFAPLPLYQSIGC